MKVVILAGGLGTRLTEETTVRPKPMVEIGGKPILWHIMKIYEHHGFNDFVTALGYKGEVIKDYFLNYHNLGYILLVWRLMTYQYQIVFGLVWDLMIKTLIRIFSWNRICRVRRLLVVLLNQKTQQLLKLILQVFTHFLMNIH